MQGGINTKKTITIYYKGTALPISIYQGTPAAEIESTIRMAFNIPPGKPIQYFDEDSTLTVLSSYINSGCKIFAKLKETYTAIQLSSPVPQVKKEIKWHWLTPSNTSHTLENGGLTVRQKQNQSQSYAYGSLLIKGDMEVYYVLIWEKFTCCHHSSVYWTLPKETFTQQELAHSYSLIDSSYLSSGPFQSLTRSDSQNRLLGFYVNMKTKTLICTDHQKKSIIGYQYFTANAVRPLVFFKHEPIITIRQTQEGCPEWLKP